jgi:hypothetical protein
LGNRGDTTYIRFQPIAEIQTGTLPDPRIKACAAIRKTPGLV